MSEVKKSDLIYFQNELLQDLKKLDIKYTEKMTQIITTFQNNKLLTDQKFEVYNDKISAILKSIESNQEFQNLKLRIEKLKSSTSEENTKISNKIVYIERDLSDISFKYDTLISSFVIVPGLIGKGSKYNNLKSFFEITDKNILDLQNYKEKNGIDLNNYKKKLETLIGQFKLQIDTSQDRYFEFCKERIEEVKKEIFDKFKIIEEKIDNMRLDNGKYSFELIKKSEELENKLNRINNMTNEVDEKMKEEMSKYQKYNKELIKTFESQKEEFKIIKIRFSELSDFIKDVRFLRNLNNYNTQGNNNKEYEPMELLKSSKQLSKKINFNRIQKVTKSEENKYLNQDKEINNNLDDVNNNNFHNETQKEDNKIENNNENKKKFNIKLNIKDKGSNDYIDINSTYNNNLNETKNNDITVNTILKNNNNSNISQNKSRNIDINKYERIKTVTNKNSNFLRQKESHSNSINSINKKKLLIRIQSQFTLQSKNNMTDIRTIIHTQHNFYPKDQNFIANQIDKKVFVEQPKSGKETIKFKKIYEKNKKSDNEDMMKIISKIDKNSNVINTKAYRNINSKFLMIEDKMREINSLTGYKFEKINRQIQRNFDLTNFILTKIEKLEKQKNNYSNKHLNSPLHINTTSESNIPLINNIDKKPIVNNTDLLDRKIKPFLNILDRNKNISSGKILNIIEPYLIKKFKSNNNQ